MSSLEKLRDLLPEPAKDIRLNLQAVLEGGSLSPAQRWGVAIASAVAGRHAPLRAAIVAEAKKYVEDAVVEDAVGAASLMAMNNVYYRFRHLAGRAEYADIPARLRMNRLVRPSTSKADFELFSLAVSAIHGCESCVRAHERVVREAGLTAAQGNDAVRIASVVHAAAVSLEAVDAP